jgi:hypothetical protein
VLLAYDVEKRMVDALAVALLHVAPRAGDLVYNQNT